MKTTTLCCRWLCLTLAVAGLSCGGSENPAKPPTPQPSPSPPAPTPIPAQSVPPYCGSLPLGPVTRVAVAPREQAVDGQQKDMLVRVNQPFTDEVLCVDKDREHKIDFNLNQRNASGKECCWADKPGWAVRDPSGVVTSQQIRDANGFILRVRIDPRGANARVGVSAELDGIESHPWQSGTEYAKGPLWIQAMSAQELKQCNCTYLGNAGYAGAGCPKSGY